MQLNIKLDSISVILIDFDNSPLGISKKLESRSAKNTKQYFKRAFNLPIKLFIRTIHYR